MNFVLLGGILALPASAYLMATGTLHLIATGMDWGSQSPEAQKSASRHVISSIAKLALAWALAITAGVLLS